MKIGWLRRRRRVVRINPIGFRSDQSIARRRFSRALHRLRRKPVNLTAWYVDAGQRGSGAAEPGPVDGGIVGTGLARRQGAPDLDRGFGFLDIFEECEFAVVTAPTAGFEQFGEVFQPLFGKGAPAATMSRL